MGDQRRTMGTCVVQVLEDMDGDLHRVFSRSWFYVLLTCSHMLLAGQTGKVEGMLLAKPGNIKAKDEDERTVRMAAGVRVCRLGASRL